jgi:hypothetical protein
MAHGQPNSFQQIILHGLQNGVSKLWKEFLSEFR